MKSMRLFLLAVIPLALFSCAVEGRKIAISGYVVDSSNTPLSNVAIIHEGSEIGMTTNGKFFVEFNVSDADNPEKVVLVVFELAGYSRGFKQFKPFGGDMFSFRVKLKKIGDEKVVAVPEGEKNTLVKEEYLMIQFGSGVLVDRNKNPVTGNVLFNIASFDTALNDFLLFPVFHYIKTATGTTLPLIKVLAMGDFRMRQNGSLVHIAEGKCIDLFLRTSPFEPITAGDNRIFRLNEETGWLEELAGGGEVDAEQNQIKVSVSLSGLFVWAKEVSETACLDIELKVDGSGKSRSSAIELNGIEFRDEVNGSFEGFYCLNGTRSSAVTLDVIHVSETGMIYADQFSETLPSLQSSCLTGGCKQVSYTIPCLSHRDCEKGQKCIEKKCTPPLQDQ